MSILLEQTQGEMHDSHAFSRRSEIADIKVVSASFSLPRSISLLREEMLSIAIRFAPQEVVLEDGCVRAGTVFECEIALSGESESAELVAKFECNLVATYRLRESYSPSPAELAAFQKANVIFNCWPFFREFVQSSACRMGITPPPIPFVRVQVIPNKDGTLRSSTPKRSRKKALSPEQA